MNNVSVINYSLNFNFLVGPRKGTKMQWTVKLLLK